MASEPTPQQFITQSAQATANTIASALIARMASISLPVYDWDSQDAYLSFSIFCHTLENWLLLKCILLDRKDHLRYVFAALGTKSLEMHTQWMPTGSEEEQKVTKAKVSVFLNGIQQGMTHNVNTHVCLGECKEIVARPGEDPQDLVACIKTLMDYCEMITDEHHEHELHCHIICAYHHEEKLLGKLIAKPFKTPSSELADIAVPSDMPENESPTAPNPWMPSARTKGKWPTPATTAMVTHHLHPPRTVPTAQDSTHLAEQTVWHVIPIAPNVTRWDQNAEVASYSNQGMHLHLGHSRGNPDAHLGTTTTTMGRVTRQTP